MARPHVSIIIPTYNAAATVGQTLRSIASLPNCEIIVVDGESEDNTLDVIRSFDLPDLTILCEKDQSVYEAMNRGILQSKGWWLYFLGANDVVHPEAFCALMDAATEELEIVYSNVRYVNRAHKKVPEIHRGSFDAAIKLRNTLHHQGTLYHRSIFDEFMFDPSLTILGDYDLNLFCYTESKISSYIDGIIADCDASTGLSKTFQSKLYREELIVKKKYLKGMEMLAQRIWVWVKYLYKNS